MSDFDGFDDFEDRARAAGRGLGSVVPMEIDPALPRQRLRRRRIGAVAAALAVVAAVGGGLAAARDGGHKKVHVVGPDNTTSTTPATAAPGTSSTVPPTATTAPPLDTSTTAPPTTTTTAPSPWIGPALTSVVDGDVVAVSADGVTRLTHGGQGFIRAYRLGSARISAWPDAVVVTPYSGGGERTLGDMQLVGAGKYHGDDVAILLDVHPDALHDNWKWIRLYDIKTGQVDSTQLSIAPGTSLDHVSIAGDLFVMSGKSDEGGPFVLYRHFDGSFDDSLPNIVAGQLGGGTVSDAVISADGTRIAYLIDKRILMISYVKTGHAFLKIESATQPGGTTPAATALDFDGRYAVISYGNSIVSHAATVFDTVDGPSRPVPEATGITTLVP